MVLIFVAIRFHASADHMTWVEKFVGGNFHDL